MKKNWKFFVVVLATIIVVLLISTPAPTIGCFVIWLLTLNQFYQLLACAAIIGIPAAVYFIFRRSRSKG